MTTLNIATFNCENLFSRPKILNLESNEAAREPLNELVKLNKILGKAKYSSADKQQVIVLLEALKDFVDLNEMRNKLIGRRNTAPQLSKQRVGSTSSRRTALARIAPRPRAEPSFPASRDLSRRQCGLVARR